MGVLALLCALGHSAPAAAQTPIRFGFDVTSVKAARDTGMPVSYGSMWAGAWNQRWGWQGIQDQLATAKANGVTPVIQWWYWGDDISPACVENGCWDARQGVQKDKATWYRMSNELADLVVRVIGPDSPAIIIVEGEFNKGGIENDEAFDGYLADHAKIFHDRNLKVVTEFGNWNQAAWPRFDRAVAASDMLGAMVLESSIHEATAYPTGGDMLLSAARYYQTTFNKPVFVTDFAFSSYPEPNYETLQDRVVADIFGRMGDLRAAGVQGMVWRMFVDDPTFDTSNYHGMAERYWGLARPNGSRKAAFSTFLNGVNAEAAVQAPAPTPDAGPAPAPEPAPAPASSSISIWWPTPGVSVKGTQPFKALIDGQPLSSYRMYWQVDGGALSVMYDSTVDAPHKEASVNLKKWTWKGQGPYTLTFVAKDLSGNVIATASSSIYVR